MGSLRNLKEMLNCGSQRRTISIWYVWCHPLLGAFRTGSSFNQNIIRWLRASRCTASRVKVPQTIILPKGDGTSHGALLIAMKLCLVQGSSNHTFCMLTQIDELAQDFTISCDLYLLGIDQLALTVIGSNSGSRLFLKSWDRNSLNTHHPLS